MNKIVDQNYFFSVLSLALTILPDRECSCKTGVRIQVFTLISIIKYVCT